MTPFVGEIRMFGGNYEPQGWYFCDGRTLAISEFDTLFNLIGTTYGGDGQETFQLPNLIARAPLHQGTGPGLSPRIIGELGGNDSITLQSNQLGGHTHIMAASGDPGTSPNAAGAVVAKGAAVQIFRSGTPARATMPGALGPVGGSQPHENRQPYLGIRYIISLFGIFPSPT